MGKEPGMISPIVTAGPGGSLLRDEARLAALAATRQTGSPPEESFDRLTRLAATVLGAPVTIISFIDGDTQFLKSSHGLPDPRGAEVPAPSSVCQFTLAGTPLLVEDARTHALLKDKAALSALGIVAYLGVPLMTPEGHGIGAFCAIDRVARRWSQDDVFIMQELGLAVMTQVGLRMALEKVERDRKLRDTLITTLTHDLRSPLSTIKLGAEIIAMSNAGNEAVSSVARRISRGVNHADQMIQTLLDAAAILAGDKPSVHPDTVDLSEVLNAARADLVAVYGERFPCAAPAQVLGKWDKLALRRVFDNLVSNAIKYGDTARPITIRLEDHGREVEFSVHNEGKPLSADECKLIFEPYMRTQSARTGRQKGWGLGLVSAKGVVEAHGGRIRVHSDAAQGTTFFVDLPKHPPEFAS